MNKYTFDDLQKGHKESFEAEVTLERMDSFRNLSGDINPLHSDESFATSKGFNGRVAYGHLTASFFSTLAGVYLPGENCLIREVSYKFMRPVYVGDKLIVSGEVTEVDDRTKEVFLKVRIYRKEDEELLVRGKMIVGVLE